MIEMDEIILSLDASSTAVGWCAAQGERYLNSGVQNFTGERDVRIREIVYWVRGMLLNYDPDRVAIEEPTGSHQNLQTDRLLARVAGAIEGLCILSEVPVTYVHAMKVKATRFHKDTTLMTARFVGKPIVGPDEADAIGVWQAALGIYQGYRLMNETSQEEVQ